MKKMSEYSMRNANGGKLYKARCTCKAEGCDYYTSWHTAFSKEKAARKAKFEFADHFDIWGSPHFYSLNYK